MLYNPHFPHIVGEEWVPIRNEELQFSPAVSSVEMGYEFLHLNNTDNVTSARYYLSRFADRVTSSAFGLFLNQPFFISLYPAGSEADSGPVNKIRVPVMSGTSVGSITASLANSTSYQQALSAPTDGRYVIMSAIQPGPFFASLSLSFSTRQYDQFLWGKRILGINVVYNAAITAGLEPNTTFMSVNLGGVYYGNATFNELGTAQLGDTNWGFATTHPGLPSPTPFPWTPTSVKQFDAADPSAIHVLFTVDSDEDDVEPQQFELYYVALDIYYCEEQRIIMGGGLSTTQGVNQTVFYTPNESFGTTLDFKKYVVTIAPCDIGDSHGSIERNKLIAAPYPTLNALRQLYPTTYHRGVQINRPSPMTPNVIGKVFTREETDVLPQITIHKASGTPDSINTVHPYGRMAGAQVYGAAFAQQTLEDSNIGSVTAQQVRYYARRFGDTSSRLELINTAAPTTIIASLSPTEWDELEPENGIIDGWKEVTLTLDAQQTFTGTRPAFRWQASQETVGNRWEVLSLIAPALSGTPLSELNQAPANYQVGIATYGAPISGTSDALRWLQVPPSTPVSAVPAAVDPTADAVLMFAVDPPAVTGIVLSEQSQALSGIAIDECVDCESCVPTGIQYHRILWDMGATDTFTRTVAAGSWGSADTGSAWTLQTGTAGNFSVDGSEGLILGAAGSNPIITQPKQFIDVENVVTMWTTAPVSGAAMTVSLVSRFTDTSNYYYGRTTLLTDGRINMAITKTVAGVTTDLVSYSGIMRLGVDAKLRMTFNTTGTMLRFMCQRLDADGDVVETAVVYATDSALTAGITGIRVNVPSTTVPLTLYFDDYCAYPAPLGDGGFYELQRMDDLTDWQTIMQGSPCSWYMNDYEARVGISSTYRMRIVDALNFVGPWSSESSHTLSSPGVTGGSCLDGVGTLIFTSNAAQDGRYNLAYTQIWEQNVQEDFVFPEASTVSLQRVYQRDFAVAFKGTERGGDQFSRNILVHNAAVSPERLANISSLRDMAWADVPYICVRDEIGDRWMALVQVPAESVRRNRKLYLATLAVTEVTDTAYPIDPMVNV